MAKEQPQQEEKKGEKKNQAEDKAQQVKKWKGKDWYSILAPKMFNGNFLAESPATDPKSLVGRIIPAMVSDLTGDKSKNYMKLFFKVSDVKDKSASTDFSGLECLKEYVSRNLRDGLEKVETFDQIKTKDNWILQVSSTIILNRKIKTKIRAKVRKHVAEFFQKSIEETSLEDFLKSVLSSAYQKKIRKEVSSLYPVRFMEIHKVEVLKVGAS